MKKLLLGCLAVVLPINMAFAASYEVDPMHTYPNFTVSHLGFSTMHGQFQSTKGSLEMDLAKGTGAVEVTIATKSINTGFKKRDDHLRSPDFFNVVEFPSMTFKSTNVKFHDKKSATITGDLTILGVTKPVVLDVASINCGKHPFNKKINEVCGFDATTKFKRSDFGMKYGLPAIGDDISIQLEVEATR